MSSKFERLCVDLEILEKIKCELSSQHKWSALKDLEKEDMIIFKAWNNIPDSYDQWKNSRLLFFSYSVLHIHRNNCFQA
jgi:hypothetical protein